MPTKIDDQSTASWFGRALAEVATVSSQPSGRDTVIDANAGNAGVGWDPHDVWLRRIEQPRRLRQRDVQSN